MSIEALANTVAAPSRLEGAPGDVGGHVGGGHGGNGDAFAQLLAQTAAGTGPNGGETVRTLDLQAGGPPGVGEEMSAGLRRFGQTVGKMQEIGAFKQRKAEAGQGLGADATQSPGLQSPVLRGPAEQDPRAARRAGSGQDHMNQAMTMAQDALGQQAQLYKVMMDFTLVHSSAESLNKSLKTLLTQGGG